MKCKQKPSPFRLFEWAMAIIMTWMGVHLVIWPDALTLSRFAALSTLASAPMLTTVCLIIGTVRIYTLRTAGQWKPWCARIRAGGGIAASAIWGQMALALFLSPGPPSISIPVFATLAGCELFTVWRARREANVR